MATMLVEADWPVANVRAFVTTRIAPVAGQGAVVDTTATATAGSGDSGSGDSGNGNSDSSNPDSRNYAAFNLATHVGDAATNVKKNRDALLALLPPAVQIQWLDQVHGTRVISVASPVTPAPMADGAFTRRKATACAVLSADCLPVFLANANGGEVAVVHAGWRGLAAGIIANAIGLFRAPVEELYAWLGPAISQQFFEVGLEVRDALVASLPASVDSSHCFITSTRRDEAVLADLFGIARLQLRALGVRAISGGGVCTYADAERFYSYRRDARQGHADKPQNRCDTGRMASIILRV